MSPTRGVIGVIAKAPLAGEVKTRLCPPLTHAEAAGVAGALLDTLGNARATGHTVCCVHAGPASALLPHTDGAPLLAQRGRGLAQRLAAAQEDLHAAGHQRVLLLGADCPTVDAAYLDGVLERLDSVDVVLGAAADGGYTLIASKRVEPALFAVQMSTERVLDETRARAAAAGLTVACLPARHDLDEIDDFAAALAGGQLDHAPRTRAVVQRLAALTTP